MSESDSYHRKALNPSGVVSPSEPFSQAVVTSGGKTLYIAGQLAVDEQGVTVGSDIASQAEQVFKNLETVLEGCGGSFSNVVKFTTFLVNASDVEGFCEKRRELFAKFFPNGDFPVNTMVVVEQLPKGEWLVEIEAFATLPE